MGKYQALGQFLAKQPNGKVPMTFAEIEGVIGHRLPPSRRYPAWWSNNPSNNPMTKVWLAAGFATEQVNIDSGNVVFRRIAERETGSSRGPHPLIGCMKGTVTIMPGVTLEEAGEEWADYLDEVYGKEPPR